MSDSGRTLSYTDLKKELEMELEERKQAMALFGFEQEPCSKPWWRIVKMELDRLEAINEQLKQDNEALRQQLGDVTRHPDFRANAYTQCFRCKDLIAGRMLDHRCNQE